MSLSLVPFSEHLFAIGIEQSLYIGIVFIVLWCVSRMANKTRILLQLGLWSLLLFRCLMPTDISSRYSLRQFLFPPKPVEHMQLGTSIHDEDMISSHDFDTSVVQPNSNQSSNWHTFLIGVWILGLLTVLILFLKQYVYYRRLAYKSIRCKDQEIHSILFRWRKKLGLKRTIRILISSEPCSPFTLGLFKPVLVLPESLLSEPYQASLESIMAHELTHIKHLDALWIWVQNLIQCLFFFHPAVWIANRKINFYRECLCDGMVISRGTIPRQTYGQSLLNSLKLSQRGPKWHSATACFVFSKSMLSDRIKNLKGGQRMNIKKSIITVVMLLGLACFLLPMAGATQEKQSADQIKTKSIEALSFTNPITDGYRVSMGYGEGKDPITKKQRFHRGIDLAAKTGTPVYAAESGLVDAPKTHSAYGKNITIDHGQQMKTFYSHLDSVSVQPGALVTKGQLIGLVGSTGRSTGSHLHFEILQDSTCVNPEDFIQF